MIVLKNKNIKDIEITKKKEKVKLSREEKLALKKAKKIERQEKKESKKESKNTIPSNKEILPFLDIDENNIFITKQGFLDIFQIETRDITNLSEFEVQAYIYNFIYFLRSYVDDFKVIGMNFPVNTVKQQEYIKRKIEKCNNEKHLRFLNEKLNEFTFLENHRNNHEFFIMIFMKNEIEKENLSNRIRSVQNIAVPLKELDLEKKLKILFKLNNMNTKLM
ncbi:hypothetical protein [Clostridium perfringens]|uniref:hypothetical protein n=1 Tax=Clostridium perfringens TaxID=1502 RepID=UPI001FA86517|nr:hypothetical protein [Clostridium perfringens]